jgi:heme d1 biosynthesis radical SAM protein NirJ
MKILHEQTPCGVKRNPPGPVVIWNLIRRCNLTCKHCYSISADTHFPGELSTKEVFTVMDDLKEFGVPVLILSGGEPLLRPDIFEVAKRAKDKGFYVGLSSNGTLIDENNIQDIKAVGFDYVGVSIDGLRENNDSFRQMQGGFDAALNGIKLCRQHGIKAGWRFTLTEQNSPDLPALLDIMDEHGVEKFYLSHLNYSGRGKRNRKGDAYFKTTRDAMDLLFDRAWDDVVAGKNTEYVTGNNDADGVYLLHWAAKRFPERVELLRQHLEQWGGNSSGVNISNIDNLGNVHPDTFWWNHHLGNVKDRPFSDIWKNTQDELMLGLRQSPRAVKGRCSKCDYFSICGGNTRVRAFSFDGDYWGEDPGCYLENQEIGLSPEAAEMLSMETCLEDKVNTSQLNIV